MINIINFPYNSCAVARLDNNNIVHNHIYHNCPVGRVDKEGIIHNHPIYSRPVGNVDSNGFVYKCNKLIGRIDGDNPLAAGAAYLLLLHDIR